MSFGAKSQGAVRVYNRGSRLRLKGQSSLLCLQKNEEEAELTSVGPRKVWGMAAQSTERKLASLKLSGCLEHGRR